MKKLVSFLVLLTAMVQVATAQETTKQSAEDVAEARKAAVAEMADSKGLGIATPGQLLTVADVGEPDSFGKNAKFLGTASTGVVVVYSSCDPAVLLADFGFTLGVDDRCLAAPNPAISVNATFNDIGRITIPGKTVDNVIYYIQTNLINYELTNPFTSQASASNSFSPSYTLVSDALNDPAAIDPNTGLPMAGSFTTGVGGTQFTFKSYLPNATENIVNRYSSSATRGFARSYFADLGLPNSVINQIYKKPLTIKLNLRVRAQFVTFGQYFYSTRFLGN